jgi:hypothetical protein
MFPSYHVGTGLGPIFFAQVHCLYIVVFQICVPGRIATALSKANGDPNKPNQTRTRGYSDTGTWRRKALHKNLDRELS